MKKSFLVLALVLLCASVFADKPRSVMATGGKIPELEERGFKSGSIDFAALYSDLDLFSVYAQYDADKIALQRIEKQWTKNTKKQNGIIFPRWEESVIVQVKENFLNESAYNAKHNSARSVQYTTSINDELEMTEYIENCSYGIFSFEKLANLINSFKNNVDNSANVKYYYMKINAKKASDGWHYTIIYNAEDETLFVKFFQTNN